MFDIISVLPRENTTWTVCCNWEVKHTQVFHDCWETAQWTADRIFASGVQIREISPESRRHWDRKCLSNDDFGIFNISLVMVLVMIFHNLHFQIIVAPLVSRWDGKKDCSSAWSCTRGVQQHFLSLRPTQEPCGATMLRSGTHSPATGQVERPPRRSFL